MSNTPENHAHHYSESDFWAKVAGTAGQAGRYLIEKALLLFFVLTDGDTPTWAKATVIAALGYFISPVDAIPDLIPVVGFSDDLAILITAIAAVASVTKPEHHRRAEEEVRKIFG